MDKCIAASAVRTVTGCEAIWGQSNRGCYVHTREVVRGNGVDRHSCWVMSRPMLPTIPPTITSAIPNTLFPTESTCAAEWEKSTGCGSDLGKDQCCPGLVCHSYQWWKCVKEENKLCAGPNTLARECGSTWTGDALSCCPDFICDFETKECVSPDVRHRSPATYSTTVSNLPTSAPTLPFNYSSVVM